MAIAATKLLFLLASTILLNLNGRAGGAPAGIPDDLYCVFNPEASICTNKPTQPSTTPSSTTAATESSASTTDSLDEFIKIHGNVSTILNDTAEGFHVQLREDLAINPKSEISLLNFSALESFPTSETYRKGLWVKKVNGLVINSGEFVPQSDGVYLVSAHIHIEKQEGDETVSSVTVQVCIDEDCNNSGLKVTTGLTTQLHTISVTGVLQLEKKQRLTVRIKSESSNKLTVRKYSSFMAFRLSP